MSGKIRIRDGSKETMVGSYLCKHEGF